MTCIFTFYRKLTNWTLKERENLWLQPLCLSPSHTSKLPQAQIWALTTCFSRAGDATGALKAR